MLLTFNESYHKLLVLYMNIREPSKNISKHIQRECFVQQKIGKKNYCYTTSIIYGTKNASTIDCLIGNDTTAIKYAYLAYSQRQ